MKIKRHNFLRSVCALALILGVSPIQAQMDHPLQLGRIVSNDRDSITTAVRVISDAKDVAYYALMVALFNGELYLKNNELVIIGDMQEDDYGDTFAPLYTAYPKRHPILNDEGKPLIAPLIDLEEIDSNRRIRALIQPYLTQMEIFHPDPGKRRVAVETLGNRGDLGAVPMLRDALEKEADSGIQSLIRVALGKLELTHPDSGIRLNAAKALGELNNTFVLSFLRARVEPDASGNIAESDPAV
ncbi:MAG: HEAT repeat domain-containing protein, partial [Gemmatimonadota bacterium]|nr:HEAT repeat domain-containing protein [Gemmatimonadota bacterium]